MVSIHAQRGGWAKRTATKLPLNSDMFQSTPSAVAGRNADNLFVQSPPAGFNPRPARWLGETRVAGDADADGGFVSIHAQRGGWAKRLPTVRSRRMR